MCKISWPNLLTALLLFSRKFAFSARFSPPFPHCQPRLPVPCLCVRVVCAHARKCVFGLCVSASYHHKLPCSIHPPRTPTTPPSASAASSPPDFCACTGLVVVEFVTSHVFVADNRRGTIVLLLRTVERECPTNTISSTYPLLLFVRVN